MLAVLGDLHLGRGLYGHDLTPHIRQTMYAFHRWCVKHRVDGAVMLGDLFDRPRPTAELEKLVLQWCNEFERSGIPLDIMIGNHDVTGKAGFPSALSVLKAVRWRYVRIIDRPTAAQRIIRTCRTDTTAQPSPVLFLPFPSPGLYEDEAAWHSDIQSAWRSLKVKHDVVVFSHLNVTGAKMGQQEWVYRGGDYELPEAIRYNDAVQLIVNGHIHKLQKVDDHLHMLGAAQRLNFGERDNPVYFGLVFNGTFEMHPYELPLQLMELEVDASAWGHGGNPPTTDEVVEELLREKLTDVLVKVQPFVDERTVVAWGEVEERLHRAGAQHVVMASPVLVKRQERQKLTEKAAGVGEPVKAARFFVRSRITDKDEQKQVMRRFKQLQEE